MGYNSGFKGLMAYKMTVFLYCNYCSLSSNCYAAWRIWMRRRETTAYAF